MGNEIIIDGERYEVSDKVTIITYEDPGGMSFKKKKRKALAKTGSPLMAWRKKKGKGKLKTLEKVKEHVNQVILHADLTRDSKKCFDVLVARGLSTHFLIDWDGVIYQGMDVMKKAFHAGDFNDLSIGIDLNNLLPNLVKKPGAPMYNRKHPRYQEMMSKEFRRPKSGRMRINKGRPLRSYGYTDAQYTALVELLKTLTKYLPAIKKEAPFDATGEIVKNVLDDESFSGFIGHWHISTQRWDPGPGFDWQRVYHALHSEHNSFPFEIVEGRNIRDLLSKDKVTEYAKMYYDNNESNESGGYYPIGLNQTWHGGIHLHGHSSTKIRAMFDGQLVAAHFGDHTTKLGSNNFILLRHRVKIPAKQKGVDPKYFTFYSLYMHLESQDIDKATVSSPKWIKDLYRFKDPEEEENEPDLEKKKLDDDEFEEDLDTLEGEKANKEKKDPEGEDFIDTGPRVPWLEVGDHITGLKRGQIALFDKEQPILVSSGDVLGTMGEFGQPDEWKRMLHLEIFADKDWKDAIDIGAHGRYLVELDDDVGTDLFIEDNNILSLFEGRRKASKTSLAPQKVLDSEDVIDFFTGGQRTEDVRPWLRKLVTRHVSEWSDRVDWVSALSSAEDWTERVSEFKTVVKNSGLARSSIETVLPFIWLNKQVAEHIGIKDYNGILNYFHPIHFLIWMTFHSNQRLKVISKGMSKRKLKQLKRAETEKARKKRECQLLGTCETDYENEGIERVDFGAEYDVEVDDDYDPTEELNDWLTGWDQGEWLREEDDNEW